MDDPRLVEWVKVTRAALEATDEDLLAVLKHAQSQRDVLKASLQQQPPENSPSADLGRQLREAETTLDELTAKARQQMQSQLAELRKLRNAAKDYRPVRSGLPAFLSRSV